MKAVLKYPGAKNRIAEWIISHIPEHDVYLEPYAGSLAVLFNKPKCHIETVNDLHGEVCNFFRILRDDGEQLAKAIYLTPWSRQEYESAYEETEDDFERARRFCIKTWQAYGNGNRYKNGFRSGQQKVSPNPANAWRNLPEVLIEAIDRLKGVQIENLDATELISRYNTKDVFIYADPPYLLQTRKSHLYTHEMTDQQHIELLNALKSHPGKVLLSGYDNDLYNELLTGWNKSKLDTQAENGLKRTETLWYNYDLENTLF